MAFFAVLAALALVTPFAHTRLESDFFKTPAAAV